MALGTLTLLCLNFILVGAASLLLIWLLMHFGNRDRREPHFYSEPPLSQDHPVLGAWRRREGNTRGS